MNIGNIGKKNISPFIINNHRSQTATLHLFLWMFGACFQVLNHAYSGSLVSFLTVDLRPGNFKSIAELSTQTLQNHAYGTGFRNELIEYADPKLNSLILNYFAIQDTSKTLQAVSEGTAAMIDSHIALEYKIRSHLLDR